MLAKDWKELHPRTKRHYASFAKQGIKPVLESIAPGQAGQLWDHVVKNSSIEDLNSSDNGCDHCKFLALSEPKNEEFIHRCAHRHSVECDRCQELHYLFESLDQAMEKVFKSSPVSDDRNDLQFLLNDSKAKIGQWKFHILRSVSQEEGKKAVLEGLATTEVLLIEDWAMKFLPLRFREKLAEFYSKRGIKCSWHATAAIASASALSVEVFVHIFDSCI